MAALYGMFVRSHNAGSRSRQRRKQTLTNQEENGAVGRDAAKPGDISSA